MDGEHSKNAHLMLRPLFWECRPTLRNQPMRFKKMLNVKHDVGGMMQNMSTCLHPYVEDVFIHVCPSYFVL
jgi:hypothetical protein